MSTTAEFIADHLPEVKVDDIQHRFTAVDIRDPQAFANELEQYVSEMLGAFVESVPARALKQQLDLVADDLVVGVKSRQDAPVAGGDLLARAGALRAATPWTPSETDIQRGRMAMMDIFRNPFLLTVQHFAELAGKSRQQIYKDIEARRLLALDIGPRKQKLPDWQLDRKKQALTQAILQGAPEVDSWTVYHALTERLEGLRDRSPVVAVETDSVEYVAAAVFNVLGIVAGK